MSSLLEIVELVNGEIVLQRADGEGEPLLRINFSDEAKAFIGEGQIEVVKAMIQAGIEATSMLQLNEFEQAASVESYDGESADLEAVEELLAEEEAHSEKIASENAKKEKREDAGNEALTKKEKLSRLSADQTKQAANEQVSEEGDSSLLKETGLGPVRASDLSSSRILH